MSVKYPLCKCRVRKPREQTANTEQTYFLDARI